MAPRHDKVPATTSSPLRTTKVNSPSVAGYNRIAEARALELIQNCILGELSVNAQLKKQHGCFSHDKRKLGKHLKHAVRAQKTLSLAKREEIMAQEHEAMMWKLKRLEVQAHAREMRRKLHKQNQEIRLKRLELKGLKKQERELRQVLEQCESQAQALSTTSASLVFRSNLNRIYMLAAALLSFLLVRIFSYSYLV